MFFSHIDPNAPITERGLKRFLEMAPLSHGPIKQLRPGVFRLGCDAEGLLAVDSRVADRARLAIVEDYRDSEFFHIRYDKDPRRPVEARLLLTQRNELADQMRPIEKGPTTPILLARGEARALLALVMDISFHHYSRKRAERDLRQAYGLSRHAELRLHGRIRALPPLPDEGTDSPCPNTAATLAVTA